MTQKQPIHTPSAFRVWHSALCLTRMRDPNLPTDPVASRERFATSRRQPHGNREGLTFLSVSIGRRESRPSSSRGWGAFSPMCRIRQGRLVSPLLSSCSPCGPRPDERLARCAVATAWLCAPRNLNYSPPSAAPSPHLSDGGRR